MKKTIFLAGILAAVLLTGCGEDKPLDSTSSSSTSTSSSTSSSSSSTSSSSLTTSSSSTSSSTTSSSSAAESSTTSSELVPDWYPGSTSTSTEPTQSTSTTSTSDTEPTQSTSSTSTTPAPDPKPIQSSSSSSSFSSQSTQSTPDIYADLWTPDAPGCTPGPYGGYYDASGNLHCLRANMPYDDKGYPIISYEDERGTGHLTYAEKLAYDEETARISAGGQPDDGDFDWSRW